MPFTVPSSSKKRWRVFGVLSIGAIWLLLQDFIHISEDYGRKLLVGTRSILFPLPSDQEVKPYDNLSIIQTQKQFPYLQPLLIFDGSDNTFKTFVANKDDARRHPVPTLLSYALRKFFPERFQKGQPSFQVMFSTSDKVPTTCHLQKQSQNCHTEEWAPYLFFGTIPKDDKALPSVKGFPNPYFLPCFLDSDCPFFSVPENPPSWDDLIPTLIWRGSDFFYVEGNLNRAFFFGVPVPKLDKETATKELMKHYDGMTPRWRGVMLSLLASQEEVPWIDVKFVLKKDQLEDCKYISYCSYNKNLEFEVATSHYMGEDEQSKYKYYIDFSGGGGTTWSGTFRKLAMPGVLFHHETIMKDWFYDEIHPWVHYIPVKDDLSDLREMYEWAESHPEECQAISKRATDFFLDFRTRENIQDIYQRLFHSYLGKVVEAYVPQENESVEDILSSYQDRTDLAGYAKYYPFCTCNEEECMNHVGFHSLYYETLDELGLAEGERPREVASPNAREEIVPVIEDDFDSFMISDERDMIDELLAHSQQNEE